MAKDNNDDVEAGEEIGEVEEAEEAAGDAEPEAPGQYDSHKAIKGCHGILAGIVAANEELNESIQGRLGYAARQRVLAAGLQAASKSIELPWELQRQAIISGGGFGGGAAADDAVGREELEALVDHKIGMTVDQAIGKLRGQSGELRTMIEETVNASSGNLESRLLSVMRENLTDSLSMLEQQLEERMKEIAAQASTDAAERERVQDALQDARRAAEKGLKAASGDELIDQIDDVRNVAMNVEDYDVGDIEEVQASMDGLEDDDDDLKESLEDLVDDEIEEEILAEEASPSAELEAMPAAKPVVSAVAEEEAIEAAEEEPEESEDVDINDDSIAMAMAAATDDSDPEAVNRYLELASKLRGRKNYPAAQELYQKVIEIDDDNFEARVGMGAVHLQTPDYDAAAEEFEFAVTVNPGSPAGYLGMGEVHFMQKEYSKAIKQYSQCLKLDDDLAQAYCNRGLSYYYQKNHKKAFLDLQKAYKLDPEIPNIKKYLQMVMKQLKKREGQKK